MDKPHESPVRSGIREVLVTPLIQAASRTEESAQGSSSTLSQPSWTHLRMLRIPDSAVSGAFTGGIVNAWQYGPTRLWAGARTGAIICTILQWGFNEFGIMRVKFVSRKLQESRPQRDTPISSPTESTGETRLSILDRLMSVVGFRKLSDDEYLRVLKKQRDEALDRIAVLEEERRERGQPHSDGDNTP
ncbi:hypothetical protein C8Q74DRAFT_86471 [Fomes fomentarius]|nr:hypothetical protein C8Q74DRAFT_86471 [Fomes fomentarius]